MGTLGPLVQGSSSLRSRIALATLFTVAFLTGAVAVFMSAWYLGTLVQISDVPVELRREIAGFGLIVLAMVDLGSAKMRSCCPISLSRQTPKNAIYKYPPLLTAVIWGFDTGLAVTTFRVAASIWGAFLLVLLGMSGSLVGFAYGIGFVLPLMTVAWTTHTVEWPLINRLLNLRPVAQLGSAAVLAIGGLTLLLQSGT